MAQVVAVPEGQMRRATDELHKMFAFLNTKFFKDEELDVPVITIQSQGKHSAYGWCTVFPIWKDPENKVEKWEINISAEWLHRDWRDTAKTLCHEMVHYYNKVHGIKDVSRGTQYHNKRFKSEAEKRGLVVEKAQGVGWGATPEWQDWAKPIIEQYAEMVDADAFKLARTASGINLGGKKGKGGGSNSIRWECPACGNIARTTKKFNIKCADCDEIMIGED